MKNLIFITIIVMFVLSCGGGSSSSNTSSAQSSSTGSSSSSYGSSSYGSSSSSSSSSSSIATLTVTSTDFNEGDTIPVKNTCDNTDGVARGISPQLSWTGAPDTTNSFVIIMDDEVAPCGVGVNACSHWGLHNIPSDITAVESNLDVSSITGATTSLSYDGQAGYSGPCPPSAHEYKITVYALNDEHSDNMSMAEAYTRAGFESGHSMHIVGQGTLTGKYGGN
jgi:Raf kinase inhibitor-like YbhB/YbcL family protein